MEPDRWAKIKEIFGAALERNEGERHAFVEEACGPDEELREEVRSLLAAHQEQNVLLDQSPEAAASDQLAKASSIGPYRLIRELGVGGMGEVWLADQSEPVRRRVALKLIRAGMYDSSTVQRFKIERQSLAVMDHPAIAKVFDAGATPAGQPYLVMEYVDGLPITTYCDEKKLPIRERLALFLQVCSGVQHAHQKAIIHRDLKPSNILVVEVDRQPAPRIIDFGLAKATSPSVLGDTLFTQAGSFLGTPGYMSPEQADTSVCDIDTRSDVYSLGVVLYELLTGFLPFDTREWKERRLDDVLRELRETDPQRPSTKVSANRDTSSTHAAARGTQSAQLVHLLRGDLDWITLKALEKERDRRYGTTGELAADVERYLQNRPVAARPASTAYRMQKYVRRHRAAVSIAAGVFALLAVFVVALLIQLRRTTRERDRADRITQFMTNMFQVSNPSEAHGNTITAREILDKSSKDIEGGLARDPEMKAQMLDVMAEVYQKLGLYSRAEPLLSEAISIRTRVLGPESRDTLQSMEDMALLLRQETRYRESEELSRKALDTAHRVLGPHDKQTLRLQGNLAWTFDGDGHFDEAVKLGRATLDQQRRYVGERDPDTLTSMRRLASSLDSSGRFPESEFLMREIITIRTQVSGPDDPDTLLCTSDLGQLLLDEGRPAEAESVLRETLKSQVRVLGQDHQNSLATLGELAVALQRQHKWDEAESLYREAIARSQRSMGPEHEGTLTFMMNLATLLDDRGQHHEAETVLRKVLVVQRRTLGLDNPHTALAMFNIANSLREQGRNAESASLFRETAAVQRRVLGPAHPDTVDTLYNLACSLTSDHKPEEALGVLHDAVELGLPPDDAQALAKDPCFQSIRGDSRFVALLAKAQERAAALATPNR